MMKNGRTSCQLNSRIGGGVSEKINMYLLLD